MVITVMYEEVNTAIVDCSILLPINEKLLPKEIRPKVDVLRRLISHCSMLKCSRHTKNSSQTFSIRRTNRSAPLLFKRRCTLQLTWEILLSSSSHVYTAHHHCRAISSIFHVRHNGFHNLNWEVVSRLEGRKSRSFFRYWIAWIPP